MALYAQRGPVSKAALIEKILQPGALVFQGGAGYLPGALSLGSDFPVAFKSQADLVRYYSSCPPGCTLSSSGLNHVGCYTLGPISSMIAIAVLGTPVDESTAFQPGDYAVLYMQPSQVPIWGPICFLGLGPGYAVDNPAAVAATDNSVQYIAVLPDAGMSATFTSCVIWPSNVQVNVQEVK